MHHLSDLEKASAQFNNMQMTDIGQTLSELSRRNEENERQITAQEKLITQLKETQVSCPAGCARRPALAWKAPGGSTRGQGRTRAARTAFKKWRAIPERKVRMLSRLALLLSALGSDLGACAGKVVNGTASQLAGTAVRFPFRVARALVPI